MEKHKNVKEIAFRVSRRVHLSGQVVKGQMILESYFYGDFVVMYGCYQIFTVESTMSKTYLSTI